MFGRLLDINIMLLFGQPGVVNKEKRLHEPDNVYYIHFE